MRVRVSLIAGSTPITVLLFSWVCSRHRCVTDTVDWTELSDELSYFHTSHEVGRAFLQPTVSPSRTKFCIVSSWGRFASLPDALSINVLSRAGQPFELANLLLIVSAT